MVPFGSSYERDQESGGREGHRQGAIAYLSIDLKKWREAWSPTNDEFNTKMI